MEKRKPHYRIDDFTAAAVKKIIIFPTNVTKKYISFGFDRHSVYQILSSIKNTDFYKSVTSFKDSSEWQDVYRVIFEKQYLYIKFRQAADGYFIVTSFKEVDDG